MPNNDDEELAEYVRCVLRIWIVSKFPTTFAHDLIPVMMDAGFLIDNVTYSASDCYVIHWKGTCYDADQLMYKFEAKWTLNEKKFSASDIHYYDLAELDIEPLRG